MFADDGIETWTMTPMVLRRSRSACDEDVVVKMELCSGACCLDVLPDYDDDQPITALKSGQRPPMVLRRLRFACGAMFS